MSKNSVYAVILAGGQGTRFWPASRKNNPKQFLPMVGENSLLQETVRRVLPFIPAGNILVVTSQGYRAQVLRQLKAYGIPAGNLLLEPSPKNTAPAIAWAAAHVSDRDPQGVMAVLPSDHLIREEKLFRQLLKDAVALARDEYLVTMGIVPSRPETGYGYLQVKAGEREGTKLWRVIKFTEKPNLARAQRYVKSRQYLWNSGMFIWRADTLLRAFDQHLPEVSAAFRQGHTAARVKVFWPKLPAVSIDYGILEKADNVVTVPAGGIGWSDLGSWEALTEVLPADAGGNQMDQGVIALDCRNTMVRQLTDRPSDRRRVIAAVGMEDVIIVDTDDAVLVCRKDQSQKVKDVVESLKRSKQDGLL